MINVHSTLSDAISACYRDPECNVIFDANCDEYMYWTYTGYIEDYFDFEFTSGFVGSGKWKLWRNGVIERKTCAWIKGSSNWI